MQTETSRGALNRALDFQRDTVALVGSSVVAIEEGWVITEPELPHVWNANHIRLARPVRFDRALELADRHLGHLPYRQVVVEHEPTGRRLERSFAEQGWMVEREVVMELRRQPERGVESGEVIEAGEEPVMGLMRRWIGEDESLEITPEGLDQVVEFGRRVARARRARLFGVAGEHGRLAAITMLFSDGSTAQVEDVYTVPEERNRGYGRALVTRAAAVSREAPHELVFIVADADDWPQHLYRRIGFEAIGRTWVFHRGG
jgi:ribosomal protein S18 acetylase RimI-like enzyme